MMVTVPSASKRMPPISFDGGATEEAADAEPAHPPALAALALARQPLTSATSSACCSTPGKSPLS